MGRIGSEQYCVFSVYSSLYPAPIGCLSVTSGSHRRIVLMALVKRHVQEEYEELASQIMNIVERIVSKTKVRHHRFCEPRLCYPKKLDSISIFIRFVQLFLISGAESVSPF